MRALSSTYVSAAVAAVILVLAACSPSIMAMNAEEAEHAAKITSSMNPRCFGRHLMDVPASFAIDGDLHAKIDDVEIQVTPMTKADFDLRIRSREAELRGLHLDGEPRKPYLRRVVSATGVPNGKIFDRSDNGMSDIGRKLELWDWQSGYFLLLTIQSTDYAGAGIDKPDRPTNTAQKLSTLLEIRARTRGRAETEIPTEPGLCIGHGFARGPASEEEDLNIPYVLTGTPDVLFNFVHSTRVRERDTLLERAAQTERGMRASGSETVRKGRRTIQGLPYEEWLMRGPTPDRVPGTMFTLHANETDRDPTKPSIELNFFNGFISDISPPGPDKPVAPPLERASLTDAESVAIWDRITATLRVRPGAF